jgi:rod shape-determining protein MreD
VIRYGAYAVIVAAGLALQTTWLTRVNIAGAAPDPVLVVVMIVGLFHGSEEGAIFGAGVGLLQDVVTGVPLGLGMLAGLCVGFAAGLGERVIYMEYIWLPALAAVVLTAIRMVVWTGAAHLVGLLQAPILDVVRVGVAAACYNGVIAVPIFYGLHHLDGILGQRHEESR